jgi:hypothetical protein
VDFSDFPPITEGQVFGTGLIFIVAGASFLVARWREQRSRPSAPPDQVESVPLTSWPRVVLTRTLPFAVPGIALMILSFVM